MIRNDSFPAGEIYHICNKSIANFGILKDPHNAQRFLSILEYYNQLHTPESFSTFLRAQKEYPLRGLLRKAKDAPFEFLAYCIMPDHYHLLVKMRVGNKFSKYINNVQSSFTRFFNLKFNRKGPLWQSRFRAVRITSNEQLLHVSRYIHLNPTTADLVKKPEEWSFSSYKGFIEGDILTSLSEISIQNSHDYKEFCEDRIDYQRTLGKIKKMLLE